MQDHPVNSRLDEVLQDVHDRFSFSGPEPISVHTRNMFGDTPLHLKAREGDLDAVSILLECGADPNAIGDFGFTPLHDAVMAHHSGIVSQLLAHGASPSLTELMGYTPADMARGLQLDEIVSLLATNVA